MRKTMGFLVIERTPGGLPFIWEQGRRGWARVLATSSGGPAAAYVTAGEGGRPSEVPALVGQGHWVVDVFVTTHSCVMEARQIDYFLPGGLLAVCWTLGEILVYEGQDRVPEFLRRAMEAALEKANCGDCGGAHWVLGVRACPRGQVLKSHLG